MTTRAAVQKVISVMHNLESVVYQNAT